MQRAELKRSGVEWSFVADVKRKKAMTLKNVQEEKSAECRAHNGVHQTI